MNIEKLRESIAAEKQRSAWDKGVTQYALELVDELAEQIGGGYVDPAELAKPRILRAALLNGAKDWREYSWSGRYFRPRTGYTVT